MRFAGISNVYSPEVYVHIIFYSFGRPRPKNNTEVIFPHKKGKYKLGLTKANQIIYNRYHNKCSLMQLFNNYYNLVQFVRHGTSFSLLLRHQLNLNLVILNIWLKNMSKIHTHILHYLILFRKNWIKFLIINWIFEINYKTK